MADAAHFAKLKQGREEWNKWRRENPRVVPDLSGSDLASAADLEGSAIWGRPDFSPAGRERALLAYFDLRRVNLTGSRLDSVVLTGADLSGANLTRANLSRADLQSANVTGATLTSSRWAGVLVADIVYDVRKLQGKCYGVGAIQDTFGDASFRRDVQDQDFLDTRYQRLMAQYPRVRWLPRPIAFIVEALAAASSGFFNLQAILGFGLLALVLARFVEPTAQSEAFNLDEILSHPESILRSVMLPFSAGALFGAAFANWFGRRAALGLWSFFDYGRSWGRVVVFAVFAIFIFGLAYKNLNGLDISLDRWGTGCGVPGCVDHPFYPWYVATMGFCTLGISDLVTPRTGVGQLIAMANVISGFATLGLLLAVLSDRFARRA